MESGSWASYQSALPIEARAGGEPDDGPEPAGRHDHEPPHSVAVCWMMPVEYPEEMTTYNHETDQYETHAYTASQDVPVGRIFGAERWRWKHVLAWKAAMEKRHGHAWIEEYF